MDNKVTKKRIAMHLEYDWVKYVAIILASILACYFLYMQINIDREFEIINVFFTCYDTEGTTVGNDYIEYMKEQGDDTIRKVRIAYKEPQYDTYGQLLTAEGFIDDVLIVSAADLHRYAPQFVPIDDELLAECVPAHMLDKLDYYVHGDYKEETRDGYQPFVGTRYGIRIDNLPKLNGNSTPFTFNYGKLNPALTEEELAEYPSEYYIAFNRQSLHVGEHGKKEKYHDLRHSFSFCNYFLTRYGYEATT